MAPEYAMEGLFSVKSDVYSFGVLLLEILSGRRNTSFRHTDDSSLIGYVSIYILLHFIGYECEFFVLLKFLTCLEKLSESCNIFMTKFI